jgi:hypothetical protein
VRTTNTALFRRIVAERYKFPVYVTEKPTPTNLLSNITEHSKALENVLKKRGYLSQYSDY